ncbi:MAG: hypothetical protein JW954_05705 [Dehalococcoidaceae bacterium]|nr:hypothetical protein [Dehalococcoidaceae bacterium]
MNEFHKIIVIFLCVGMIFLNSCYFKQVTPIPESTPTKPLMVTQAADDIVPTPGGYAYRGNIHQLGEEDIWPSIDTVEVAVGDNDSAKARYRNIITTKAGQTRNNILSITAQQFTIDELTLGVINMPKDANISVEEITRWHGPLGVVSPVLLVIIEEDVKPGTYTFDIGIAINGKDYKFIPCTIEVLPAD